MTFANNTQTFQQKSRIFFSVFLIFLSLFCFWKLSQFDFINLDDPDYVKANPHVLGGLTLQNVQWAWTANYAGNWHPLTWMVLQTEQTLFGLNPGAYHVVNLGFHLLSTLLLFSLFLAMTARPPESFFIAALFAVHPMHVESVAWITEIKDVLSTFLIFLTLKSYVRYAQNRSYRAYCGALIFFILSLTAKQMYVTLPAILLFLDYWPLGRIPNLKKAGPLIYEKIPFFILALAAMKLTFWAQHVHSFALVPVGARVQNAVFSYFEYLRLFFWPDKVAVLYPFIIREFQPGPTFAGLSLLGILTFLTVKFYRQFPYMVIGWLLYLTTLLPVIGLFQVGSQSMATRYTYFPYIGLNIIAAFGLTDFFARRRWKNSILILVFFVIIAGFAARTHQEVQYWKTNIPLFTRAAALIERNSEADFLAGLAYYQEDKYEEAEKHLNAALKYLPHLSKAYVALGGIFLHRGQCAEAEQSFVKAFPGGTYAADMDAAIGSCYLDLCNIEKAKIFIQKALTRDPNQKSALALQSWILALGADTLEKQVEHCKISQAVKALKPISGEIKMLKSLPKPLRLKRI